MKKADILGESDICFFDIDGGLFRQKIESLLFFVSNNISYIRIIQPITLLCNILAIR